MVIPEKELADVISHGELEGAGFVVLFKINTCIFLPLPVSNDRVLFLQCVKEILCVLFADIFNAKIIDG